MQQHPEDNPSMASVVLTLGGESALPKLKEPGLAESPSNYEMSTSLLEGPPALFVL